MSQRRAVVVGLGVTAPCGVGTDSFWAGLISGVGFARLLDISTDELPLVGCPVPAGEWERTVEGGTRRGLDRIAVLGLAAATEAFRDFDCLNASVPSERRAIVVGVGFGGISTLAAQHRVLLERGPHRLSPFGVPAVMASSVAGHAALRFNIRGPSMTVSSACASGTQAIVESARLIEYGLADVVLAGGAEAPLDLLPMASFARMRAMTTEVADPSVASRPFDVARSGFVLGEGAAFLLLADSETAARLGLREIAEVAGGAVTTDAFHIASPERDGHGAARCMADAIRNAGIAPNDIAHVNAHGTATRLNDLAESRALEIVFGPGQVPITSCKGAIGHLMGGAGAVEAVAAVLAMNRCLVPPTANCVTIDPEIRADVVRETARSIPTGATMTCSFGFGGQNAAVVFAPVGPRQ